MNQQSTLYDSVIPSSEVPRGLDLVVTMSGFADAGGVTTQIEEVLLDSIRSRRVVDFHVDDLVDYRSRRPSITFDQDHFSDLERPELVLDLIEDQLGKPFLYLHGYEPDYRWNAVVRDIVSLVDEFGVRSTTWIHSVGLPVPHTRPIVSTVSGTRMDMVDRFSAWRPRSVIPASFLHVLEMKLASTGHVVTGFAILTPHYLSDTEFPQAAIAGIERLGVATGLVFPTSELREQGIGFLSSLTEQLHSNPEFARLVNVLEERHDAFLEGEPLEALAASADDLPSGDEIAAEFEKYLADRGEGNAE